MPYIISSTEKNNCHANEFETKALLYLMNLSEGHEDACFFVIDVLNDITAHSTQFDKTWDLQSKSSKTSSAKEIGRELVTLFKNYLSDFEFDYHILFLGGVPDSFRIDNSKTTFNLENIQNKAIESLKSGLIDEAKLKTYIDDSKITEQSIIEFLRRVTFVIDDKSRIEYMHTCIGMGKVIVPRDEKLERMFSSIKSMQSAIKSNGCVEGLVLDNINDVLFLGRHLTRDKIRLKILNDLIGDKLSNNTIPNGFIDVLNKYDLVSYQREDIVEDCRLNLCKVYCDINNDTNFWKLFSHLCSLVEKNKDKGVDEIYNIADKELFKNVRDLQPNTSKFFIALVMEASL